MVISNKLSTAITKMVDRIAPSCSNRGSQATKRTHTSHSSKEDRGVAKDMAVEVDQEGEEGEEAHEWTQNSQYGKKGKEAEVGEEP